MYGKSDRGLCFDLAQVEWQEKDQGETLNKFNISVTTHNWSRCSTDIASRAHHGPLY